MNNYRGYMMDGVDSLPFNNNTTVIVPGNHNTDDIIDSIEYAHKKYGKEYDGIAPQFWRGDVKKTAANLFDFTKERVRYDIEPDNFQTVKRPGAIMQQGFGDCKHYASFIVGVCQALKRKGYPIDAGYRFVSDNPDKDVHHVFAVVRDGKKEYWTDPVLKNFNEQPNFHNTIDDDMAVYEISGTSIAAVKDTRHDLAINMPMVAGNGLFGIGKKKGNFFQKIAHGFKVNAQNIKHGMDVNAANAKKMVLKVSLAPARGSFLALVDLNAFNLATRLADTWNNHPDKKAKLIAKWKDMGGTETGLKNAIYNGIKHKAAVHHQAPAKHLKGFDDVPMISGLEYDQLIQPAGRKPLMPMHRGHHLMRYHPHRYAQSLRHAYMHPTDDTGNYPRVRGINGIGFAPVAIPAMLALASAIIAILKQFIKPSPADDAAMHAGAQQGVSDVLDQAAGTEAGLPPGALPGGMPGMNISAGVDADGNPVIQVNNATHPQIQNAGEPTGGGGGSAAVINPNAPDPGSAGEDGSPASGDPNALVNVPKNVGTDVMRDVVGPIKDQAERIWAGYKKPIMIGTGVLLGYKILSGRKKGRGKKSFF